MDEQVQRKLSFEKCMDRKIMENHLKVKFVDEGVDFLSYADLSKVIARNVQGEARSILIGARKTLLAEHAIMTETVINEGIAKSRAYSGRLAKATKAINRASKRAISDVLVASAQDEDIENGERISMNAALSALGAIALCSNSKALKKLEGSIAMNPRQLPTAETLELFAK